LPTVFLAEHVRGDMPLVDSEMAFAVGKRIDLLGRIQERLPIVRNELIAVMDRLLDGNDPLNVLAVYATGQDREPDELQVLRELAVHAVRVGVLPVVLDPFGQVLSTRLDAFVREVSEVIGRVRAALDLPVAADSPLDRFLQAVAMDAAESPEGLDEAIDPSEVSYVIRAELEDLAEDLSE